MGNISDSQLLNIFAESIYRTMVGDDGTTAAAQDTVDDALSRWDQIVATARLTSAQISVALAAQIDMYIRVMAEESPDAANGARLYLLDAVRRAGDEDWSPLSKREAPQE